MAKGKEGVEECALMEEMVGWHTACLRLKEDCC